MDKDKVRDLLRKPGRTEAEIVLGEAIVTLFVVFESLQREQRADIDDAIRRSIDETNSLLRDVRAELRRHNRRKKAE